MPLRTLTATRYVTALREGGSLPAIVEADDQGLYMLKFRGAGQGAKALVAELVAGEIARAASLPVPEIVFIIGKLPRASASTGSSRRAAPLSRPRPPHTGRCEDPPALLERLMRTMVRMEKEHP